MPAIDVGGVEEGHPGVEGGVERLAGPGRVHRAADVVEAEADDGDDEPGPAERAVAHEVTLCRHSGAGPEHPRRAPRHAAEHPGQARRARRRAPRAGGFGGTPSAQTAVWPPSTTSVCPVMNDDASLARNTAGPAISSALAHRPIGIVAVRPA